MNWFTSGKGFIANLVTRKLTTDSIALGAAARVTVSVDPGSITNAQNLAVAVTVAGVKTGDTIIATPPGTLEAGIIPVSARATGANTVTLTLYNATAAPVNPAAANWVFTIVG